MIHGCSIFKACTTISERIADSSLFVVFFQLLFYRRKTCRSFSGTTLIQMPHEAPLWKRSSKRPKWVMSCANALIVLATWTNDSSRFSADDPQKQQRPIWVPITFASFLLEYSGPPFCKCPSILFQGAFTYVHVYSTFIMNGFKAVHNYLWKSIWRFSLNQHTIGPSYLEVSWRSKYLCLLGWSWFGMKLAFFSIFVKIEPLWKWPPFSSSSNYCLLQQHVTKNVQ